eukprot:gene21219-28130_t
MVCPLCIAAAITANAPSLVAAFGGVAAIKVAMGGRDRPSPRTSTASEISCEKTGRVSAVRKPEVKRAPPLSPMFFKRWEDDFDY